MIDLVTTSSVRAVLGVSAKELPDTVLTNPIYAVQLREDLRDVSTQLLTDFAAVAALDTRTDDQERFVELTSTYAAYHVANQCLGALPMFSFQTIMDEKAELTRNGDPFKRLREDVPRVMGIMRARMRDAYAKINASAPAPAALERTFAVTTGLATDPVTVG